MIVRMKEIALFTSSRALEETVLQLGELGVVDIEEVEASGNREAARRQQAIQRVERALGILEAHTRPGKTRPQAQPAQDPRRIADRLLISLDFQRQCHEKLEKLRRDQDWYEAWGTEVNPRDIERLRRRGIHLRLYRLDRNALATLPSDLPLVTLRARKGKTPVVHIATDPKAALPFPEDSPPSIPYAVVQREIAKKERQAQMVEVYWEQQADQAEVLRDYLDLLRDRLRVVEVVDGMADVEGKVRYLRGFIPQESIEAFREVARQQQWGYQIKEPERPDEVPVHIRNPRWIRIIDPVMKFIGIVPGYEEVDVSIFFLLAFALFFAMLVGDAGYGAVFLVLTLLLRKRLPWDIRILFFVLSGATIVWGVLSGTYFGAEQIAALPFFNRLIIEDIASFGADNLTFMMHLSFLIGAIHLTVAHGIQVARLINSTRALSQLGWIALVWALFFVVEQLVLGQAMPAWNLWLFLGGTLLVTLFSQEGKTLGQSMLISIANLPLSLINGFSDIVSYVRLFAVGLATAAVAASFNNMVLPPGAELNLLQMLGAAVALLLGHGLNIALALMAVMVHGIRLNMLEFAGHLGVQFSGRAYQPFQLKALLRQRDDTDNQKQTT